jgi:hypothetical protein
MWYSFFASRSLREHGSRPDSTPYATGSSNSDQPWPRPIRACRPPNAAAGSVCNRFTIRESTLAPAANRRADPENCRRSVRGALPVAKRFAVDGDRDGATSRDLLPSCFCHDPLWPKSLRGRYSSYWLYCTTHRWHFLPAFQLAWRGHPPRQNISKSLILCSIRRPLLLAIFGRFRWGP